ncbi:hypothetical protein WJX74_002728 [Apatococcus lobatus]|uniref:Uncharacterized protein n=1 Tax=Apatococcus lobatus TaxID=904363 RepID=A0AAW1QBS0_9CHLO
MAATLYGFGAALFSGVQKVLPRSDRHDLERLTGDLERIDKTLEDLQKRPFARKRPAGVPLASPPKRTQLERSDSRGAALSTANLAAEPQQVQEVGADTATAGCKDNGAQHLPCEPQLGSPCPAATLPQDLLPAPPIPTCMRTPHQQMTTNAANQDQWDAVQPHAPAPAPAAAPCATLQSPSALQVQQDLLRPSASVTASAATPLAVDMGSGDTEGQQESDNRANLLAAPAALSPPQSGSNPNSQAQQGSVPILQAKLAPATVPAADAMDSQGEQPCVQPADSSPHLHDTQSGSRISEHKRVDKDPEVIQLSSDDDQGPASDAGSWPPTLARSLPLPQTLPRPALPEQGQIQPCILPIRAHYSHLACPTTAISPLQLIALLNKESELALSQPAASAPGTEPSCEDALGGDQPGQDSEEADVQRGSGSFAAGHKRFMGFLSPQKLLHEEIPTTESTAAGEATAAPTAARAAADAAEEDEEVEKEGVQAAQKDIAGAIAEADAWIVAAPAQAAPALSSAEPLEEAVQACDEAAAGQAAVRPGQQLNQEGTQVAAEAAEPIAEAEAAEDDMQNAALLPFCAAVPLIDKSTLLLRPGFSSEELSTHTMPLPGLTTPQPILAAVALADTSGCSPQQQSAADDDQQQPACDGHQQQSAFEEDQKQSAVVDDQQQSASEDDGDPPCSRARTFKAGISARKKAFCLDDSDSDRDDAPPEFAPICQPKQLAGHPSTSSPCVTKVGLDMGPDAIDSGSDDEAGPSEIIRTNQLKIMDCKPLGRPRMIMQTMPRHNCSTVEPPDSPWAGAPGATQAGQVHVTKALGSADHGDDSADKRPASESMITKSFGESLGRPGDPGACRVSHPRQPSACNVAGDGSMKAPSPASSIPQGKASAMGSLATIRGMKRLHPGISKSLQAKRVTFSKAVKLGPFPPPLPARLPLLEEASLVNIIDRAKAITWHGCNGSQSSSGGGPACADSTCSSMQVTATRPHLTMQLTATRPHLTWAEKVSRKTSLGSSWKQGASSSFFGSSEHVPDASETRSSSSPDTPGPPTGNHWIHGDAEPSSPSPTPGNCMEDLHASAVQGASIPVTDCVDGPISINAWQNATKAPTEVAKGTTGAETNSEAEPAGSDDATILQSVFNAALRSAATRCSIGEGYPQCLFRNKAICTSIQQDAARAGLSDDMSELAPLVPEMGSSADRFVADVEKPEHVLKTCMPQEIAGAQQTAIASNGAAAAKDLPVYPGEPDLMQETGSVGEADEDKQTASPQATNVVPADPSAACSEETEPVPVASPSLKEQGLSMEAAGLSQNTGEAELLTAGPSLKEQETQKQADSLPPGTTNSMPGQLVSLSELMAEVQWDLDAAAASQKEMEFIDKTTPDPINGDAADFSGPCENESSTVLDLGNIPMKGLVSRPAACWSPGCLIHQAAASDQAANTGNAPLSQCSQVDLWKAPSPKRDVDAWPPSAATFPGDTSHSSAPPKCDTSVSMAITPAEGDTGADAAAESVPCSQYRMQLAQAKDPSQKAARTEQQPGVEPDKMPAHAAENPAENDAQTSSGLAQVCGSATKPTADSWRELVQNTAAPAASLGPSASLAVSSVTTEMYQASAPPGASTDDTIALPAPSAAGVAAGAAAADNAAEPVGSPAGVSHVDAMQPAGRMVVARADVPAPAAAAAASHVIQLDSSDDDDDCQILDARQVPTNTRKNPEEARLGAQAGASCSWQLLRRRLQYQEMMGGDV